MNDNIATIVRRMYQAESAAHDLSHLERVCGLALRLAQEEGGEAEVVMAASYLHDLHRHVEREAGHRVPAEACDQLARELLRQAGVAEPLHARILAAIHYTEAYSFAPGGRSAAALECRLVRDADNLDAMGAIGVARAFVYGARLGERLYDPAVPLLIRPYQSGAPCPSVIHHFQEKLLRLRDDLDTSAAQRLGARRHAYLQTYMAEFLQEWDEAMGGR